MPIHVVGIKFRVFASAKPFGVFDWGAGRTASVLTTVDRYLLNFGSDQSSPGIVFDDEEITIEGQYHPSRLPFLSRLFLTAVIESSSSENQWEFVAQVKRTLRGENIKLDARVRLQPGVKEFRVRVTEGITRETHTRSFAVRVRRSPNILTFIAMGGSSSIGSGSSGPSGVSSESGGGSSNSTNLNTSSGTGITVDPTKCGGVDPGLIEELMHPNNLWCNNLCEGCVNFIEHLGLRVLEEEGLASTLESLRHKERTSEPDFCHRRTNPDGISHRIVLGKWENSEHELLRPAAIKTFESILDEFQQDGGGTLLIVANSLAGAKFQATITNPHWRWGNSIDIALFVAWDITHTGGAIEWVGTRPARVVNFFQRDNIWFQTGGPITEADVETDLTGCFSHNAIARSSFVHQSTYNEIRNAV